MCKSQLFALAVAGAVLSLPIHASGFADAVIAYNSGAGFATEFGSGLGYTNQTAVLGEPSRITPGQFGSPVDPFSPPYLRDQLISVGSGGAVTIRLETPALNSPENSFGIDFIIFGSSGFVITNGDFSGGGITDGTLFGAAAGATRVAVSTDNITYYTLDPSVAPVVDGLAPTDGSGDFRMPVDPNLAGKQFAGLDLAGIRALYAGAGGGTGYDISWAIDETGQEVILDHIRYVRIDVLEGASEIDAIGTVSGKGQQFFEDFVSDPFDGDWSVFGEASQFEWDSENQRLKVTWDSGLPNSYFYWPLNAILTKIDDFSIGFDLTLEDIAVGLRPERPFTFQIALGLLRLSDATSPDFLRGTGSQSPNLVEFNYFPDSGFGATISPVVVSSDNQFVPGFSYPLELSPGVVYRVNMRFNAADQTLVTEMRNGDAPFGPVEEVKLPSSFSDFEVDTFAVSSFIDRGADGSVLARGAIDNVLLTFPDPAVSGISGSVVQGEWRVELLSRQNWFYTLERSDNLVDWGSVDSALPGTGGLLLLTDSEPLASMRFYRVRADRP